MTLKYVRRIRGSIHGSIDTTALEDLVISHPYFQRLRRVRQTAFLNFVFPGASHSRFEHSLGVMHLAGLAWLKIKDNQERLERSTGRYRDFASKEKSPTHGGGLHGLLHPSFARAKRVFKSGYILQCLRLAGLMHDLGHPPFSHSGERFLPFAEDILRSNPSLPDYLKEHLQISIGHEKLTGREMKVSHETYTILLIWKVLHDLKGSSPLEEIGIDPRDVISIINPSIKSSQDSEITQLGAIQLCHQLVSGEVDIDRMDYLRRDSKEAGVVYGIFDGDRILDSLGVYYNQSYKNLHLAIQFSGLAAFEDYLRARQSMYLQLYFHKTSVAAEAMMQYITGCMENWSLPASIEEYCKLDEYNIAPLLLEQGKIHVKNKEDYLYFKKVVNDLLFNRKLWKRVFEISGTTNSINSDPSLKKAQDTLDKLGIKYEKISTTNSLTKFRSRKLNQMSSNYLRLIKKDSRQFPRVVPIEDYSGVMQNKNSIHICRLYIDASTDEQIVSRVKEKLIEDLDTFE